MEDAVIAMVAMHWTIGALSHQEIVKVLAMAPFALMDLRHQLLVPQRLGLQHQLLLLQRI